MDRSQILNLIPELIELSREVSKEIMLHYQSGYDVKKKEDQTFVTSADMASNDLIIKKLNELTPSIKIISEENETLPHSERMNEDWVWCIDPLDGTKEFIAGNGEFSVNIALIHLGSPIVGFVVIPSRDCIYYAVKNVGAFKVTADEKIQKLEIPREKNVEIVKVATSRSHHNFKTEKILRSKFSKIAWLPLGSSLKFTEMAEGRADTYLKIGKTMEWDIAAPQIILEETGGKIVSYPDAKPLKYNKKNLENPDFVAYRSSFDF